MGHRVTAFTDTYLPTVNGVTYTLQTWRDRWVGRGGQMDVVYPDAGGHEPVADEYPVRSIPFPFYDGYRIGLPRAPSGITDTDIVHAHTPFGLGLAGLRMAKQYDVPFVASYHTPTGEYTSYISSTEFVARKLRGVTEAYERWFFGQADAVLAPSEATRSHLVDEVGVETPVSVVSNGVDVDRFAPVDSSAFLERHGIDTKKPLLGYTGRHGYEKRIDELLDAAAEMDVTVVLGGDGPARSTLESQARRLNVDAHFLGFLDRDELPAFYSALDAFAFPSPVETQGLVALEANACGTPVVGANSAALANTILDGETGYHFESGNVESFRESIRRTLADRDALADACLARRDAISVDHAIDRLGDVYDDLQ